MKAAVLRQFGQPLCIEDRPTPEPKGEEILVRVLAAGVCHSDLHLQDGAYPNLHLPLVLGHEIAGVAEGIGQVLVYASWSCGLCNSCRAGNNQLCPEATEAGWARDGGYAEYVLVPSRKYLIPLEGLDPITAAPLADAGCTPYRAVQRICPWLDRGCNVVVIGAGGLGQFAIQYLRLLTPSKVIVIDHSDAKRLRALELGAHEASSPDAAPEHARAVLDFVGSDDTLRMAARIVDRSGIVVQVGEGGGRLPFGLGLIPHEAVFTTSIWGSPADLAAVLEHARRGEIQMQVQTMPLQEVNEAFDRLRRGGVRGRLVLLP
ncbi:MAG: alcohol dehydrogenase catalytic domain-containing protein [Acidobacteriota bacterium]